MPRAGRPFLFSLLFISGAAGLIYETVFLYLVQGITGGSLAALSLTLAVFMLGLAAGGGLGAKLASSPAPPLKIYARAELLLALAAWGSFGLYALYLRCAPLAAGIPSLRFGCAALMVLPVPLLLGLLLPLWIRAFTSTGESAGKITGRLYCINTLGAAAGAFAAGFFLLERLGIAGTLALGSALNVLIGLSVLKLSGANLPAPGTALSAGKNRWRLPFVYSVLGFVGLGAEIAWMRILELRYLSTAYSFATVLSALLTGSAFGGLFFGKRFDLRPQKRLADLAFFLLLTAGIGIGASPYILGRFLRGVPIENFAGLVGIESLVTLAGILMPALMMGFTFPLMMKLSVGGGVDAGPASGRLFAANTLGALLACLLIPLVFIPHLGLSGTLLGLTALCLAAAPLLLHFIPDAGPLLSWRGLFLFPLAAAALYLPLRHPLNFSSPEKGEVVAYYREGPMATVEVVDYSYSPVRALKVNAIRTEGGTNPEALRSQRLEALLPAFVQGQPADILFLGLGTGISLGGFKDIASVKSIDCVEILKELKEASSYFAKENRDILKDPRVKLILDDARHFVSVKGKQYDLIVGDLFFPWLKGSGALYTREHFRHCKNRLRPGGVFCQWLPLYQLSEGNFQAIANTFAREFPRAELWFGHLSPNKPTAMLAGFREPGENNGPDASEDPENFSALRLRRLQYDSSLPTVTDFRPSTEFRAAREIFLQEEYAKAQLERRGEEYRTLNEKTGLPDPARERVDRLLQAIVLTNRDDVEGALEVLGKAAENDKALQGFEFILPILARKIDGAHLDRFVPALIPPLAAVTERYGESGELFAELGKFRLMRKEAGADLDLTKALLLNPKDENAWTNLGIAHAVAGRDSQAIAAWKKTLELNPANVGAAYNIRLNLEKQGKAPR